MELPSYSDLVITHWVLSVKVSVWSNKRTAWSIVKVHLSVSSSATRKQLTVTMVVHALGKVSKIRCEKNVVIMFSDPSKSGCPYGCDGCPSSFCQCHDYANNPDFISCEADLEEVYMECLALCETSDFDCLGSCSRDYYFNLDNCPCRSNCPGGCPCENYDCTA